MFSSGSRNEDKPDVIETIDQRLANDNRNTGLRSPVDPPRHRRQRRLMRPTDVARSVRRLQRHSTCPKWMLFQVYREAFAPTAQQQQNETSAGYARCSELQTSLISLPTFFWLYQDTHALIDQSPNVRNSLDISNDR